MESPNGLTSGEVADIHRQYLPLLVRRCRRVIRDDARADDVLQEAFVKLLRHGSGYREVTSKLAWLYRVVDNCCFSAQERRRERPATAAEIGRAVPWQDPATVSRIAARRALGRLTPRSRQIAVLALVDGISQEQIGAEMGVSRQAVNRRLRSIRRRLAQWLSAG
jgi:RNA polymerase sigma-70 factor, ECF subfamily